MPRKLDSPVSSPLFPLPSPLRRDDPDGRLLFARRRQDSPRLPPFVVRRVCHVEDVTVAEGEPSGRQSVVSSGIVVEQCSEIIT